MEQKTSIIIMWILVLISILGTIYFYDNLPEIIPIHWNIDGEIDGYAPKQVGAFLLPIISLIVALIFVAIPFVEPNKKNLKKFMKQYNIMAILLIAFLAYLHYLVLYASIGEQINMSRMIAPAIGILFFYIGIVLEKAKQNYTVGIRTPWTLASEITWEKTHKLGAILFKISGIISFTGLFIPNYAFILMFFPIIISAVILVIYSFYIFRTDKNKSK